MSTSSKSSVRRGCGLDVSAANVVAAFLSWLVVTEPQGSPQSPLHAGKAEMAVAQSCPTPRTVVLPGCSGHGIPQARLLERVAVPCSSMLGVAAKVLSVFVAAQDQRLFLWGTATCSKSSAGTQGLLPPRLGIGGKPSRARVVMWQEGRRWARVHQRLYNSQWD